MNTGRVIQTAPEFWTKNSKHKDIVMPTETTPGDTRRAIAIVCHHGAQDITGVNAILREADNAGRVPNLVTAVLSLHRDVAPQLLTKDGEACMVNTVASFAHNEGQPVDLRRGASVIMNFADDYLEGATETVNEALQGGHVTELLLSILSIYVTVLPQLYSPLGLRSLRRDVANWAAQEGNQ